MNELKRQSLFSASPVRALGAQSMPARMFTTQPPLIEVVEESAAPGIDGEPADAETKLTFTNTPFEAGTNGDIKILQMALNNNYGENLKVDGVYGPKTFEALVRTDYNIPLSQSDYDEIIGANDVKPPAPDNKTNPPPKPDDKKTPPTDEKPKQALVPWGDSYKKDTKMQKALVWGFWLLAAMLITWGIIEAVSGDKKQAAA